MAVQPELRNKVQEIIRNSLIMWQEDKWQLRFESIGQLVLFSRKYNGLLIYLTTAGVTAW